MFSNSLASDTDARQADASLSDLGLVEAARRGDMRAFERLYRLHSGKVLGLCLRMTRQREIAEDCVQQTFVRAWRNLAAFERRSAFSTWLHRIAVNEVLTHARNRGTRSEGTSSPHFDEEEDALDNMADVAVAADSADVMDVEKALASCCKPCMAIATKKLPTCSALPSALARRSCTAAANSCASGWA
jgi:RNA polymerase sigma factor (sigma-70 family)